MNNLIKTSAKAVPAAKRVGKGWLALGAVGALALAYAVVRNRTAAAERAHPPAGQFITVDGVRLHYLDQGDGPVLVLLHGNITMAEDFRNSGLMGELSRSFRVIAFDRPGFGYSERPRSTLWTPAAQARLLQQALQQLGAERYLVLGHSWGTMVALAMAQAAPQQVTGLLLLAGYYYPSLRLDVPGAALPAVPLLGDLLRYTVSPLWSRLMWPLTIKASFSPSRIAATFKRLPAWLALRPSQVRATAAEAALMVPAAATLQRHYRELTMPVTILAGEGDKVVDPQHNAVRLHEEIPNSTLRLFPEAGHMLQHLVQADIAAEARRLGGGADLKEQVGDLAAAVASGPERGGQPRRAGLDGAGV